MFNEIQLNIYCVTIQDEQSKHIHVNSSFLQVSLILIFSGF